ncbi:MAG TPA: hypothetical protein VG317_22275 [Pseudonocardiaceae bacterium]|jgi:hypothetical protein|nr:hypothetical protein [Pseudonocardiaceae bacterium]
MPLIDGAGIGYCAAVVGIRGYASQLDSVIASLDQAVKQYGSTEDANKSAFQNGTDSV